MHPIVVQITRKLLVYTFILAIAGYVSSLFVPTRFLSPTIPYLYVFFLSVAMIYFFLLVKAIEHNPKRFINRFMVLTLGKLALYFSLIVVYSLIYRNDAVAFILAFVVLYTFFTIFEIKMSLAAAKLFKNKG